MSRFSCRGSVVRAAAVAALLLLWAGPSEAQVWVRPGDPVEPGGLMNNLATGAARDIVDQAKAERRLRNVEARLQRDAFRGGPAAVSRDAWRAHNLRYRIVVDGWLIRQTMLCDPGVYPYPLRIDPQSCAAMADVRRPQWAP